MTIHTQDDILIRFEAIKGQDVLGFRSEALLEFMDYEHAKGLLKKDVSRAEWNEDVSPLTREQLIKTMREYMVFAWEKALDERGISASRSVDKMGEWLWILGDREILAKFEAADYAMYGKPKLRVISEAYGFPIPEYDEELESVRGEFHG